MGLLDFFKPKQDKQVKPASTVVGWSPSFSQFGDDIMKDDSVRTITNIICDEYSKLQPRHIRIFNGRQVSVKDNNINRILNFPNKLMTKADFLRKIAWLRETYDNAFIYPVYDLYFNERTGKTKKVYKAFYPLHVVRVDYYEDDFGVLYVDFTFPNGAHSGKLLYNEVVHWRKDYGPNEFMGGDINGFPDNSSLLRWLQENDKLVQSTFKSIEASLKINGVLKIGGLLDEEAREKARIDFEKMLESSDGKIATVDIGADYIPVPYNGIQLDSETLKFYDEKIRNHYRVSEPIVKGDYTPEQKEAFYESVMESGALSLGYAFSRVVLSDFERANGNEIIFYTNKVQMMSADKKRDLANLLLPIGGVTADEIRSWYGMPPIEGGDEPMMSLNWIKKSIADEYQLDYYINGKGASNSNTNLQNDDKISTNDDIIIDEEEQQGEHTDDN